MLQLDDNKLEEGQKCIFLRLQRQLCAQVCITSRAMRFFQDAGTPRLYSQKYYCF